MQGKQLNLRNSRYVAAFGELAKASTTMLLPGNPGDVGAAVAQAMAIYGKVSQGRDIMVALILRWGQEPLSLQSMRRKRRWGRRWHD